MAHKSKGQGIYYGWVIVAAGLVILTILYGTTYSYSVFLQCLCEEFGWTRAMVSGAYSLFVFIHNLVAPIAGIANDKYRPRRVMLGAIISMGIGIALLSRVSVPWQLYVSFGVLGGIGVGFAYLPIVSAVMRWFVKKRGLALGITTAGIGVGTLAFAPLAQFLILKVNWRTSYLIMAGIVLIVALPLSQFLMKFDPAEKGLSPYGQDEVRMEKFSNNHSPSGVDFTLKEALKEKQFWLVFVMIFCTSFPLQMVMSHVKIYATDVGIQPIIAATVLGLVGGFGILGRITVGSASDRIGVKKSYLITTFLMAIMIFWLLQARELWQFYLFSILFGLGYGGNMTLNPKLVGDWFGTKNYGAILGTLMIATAIGGGLGPVIGGYLHDILGNYHQAFRVGGIVLFIGFVLAFLLRAPSIKTQIGKHE
jgi:MFS family permease